MASMSRALNCTALRIVFIALAIGLWVPMAVLVQGALQSVALEREVRHQTLAERVFARFKVSLIRVEIVECRARRLTKWRI